MTTGLNRADGRLLSDADHLRQSVADILLTPVGSRIMRRDYGSYLPDLIDQPANPVQRLAAMASAADALRRWEPRLLLQRLNLGAADTAAAQQGRLVLDIEAEVRNTATPRAAPAAVRLQVTLA